MILTETYVNLALAKLLQELEFDVPAIGVYVDGKLAEGLIKLVSSYSAWPWNQTIPKTGVFQFCFDDHITSGHCMYLRDYELISAPTLDVAEKYLREEYNIHIQVIYDVDTNTYGAVGYEYNSSFSSIERIKNSYMTSQFKTYEKALSCILLAVCQSLVNKIKTN